MPAYLEHLSLAGTKWGGGYGENNKTGNLPYMMQVAILNSPITGEIYSIMGSTWLTTTKTGSETALSGKFLAQSDDLVVTVVGVGLQGRASVGCWLALDEMGIFQLYRSSPGDGYGSPIPGCCLYIGAHGFHRFRS
jgi:ornithine cyclodeaminase/alanine dehydrogenase-like protein (mu-crystallin family)